MAKYTKLDQEILIAISAKKNPLYGAQINAEARLISNATGREIFRIIDGRLQALRKSGRIQYLTKVESNGKAGWIVTGE